MLILSFFSTFNYWTWKNKFESQIPFYFILPQVEMGKNFTYNSAKSKILEKYQTPIPV